MTREKAARLRGLFADYYREARVETVQVDDQKVTIVVTHAVEGHSTFVLGDGPSAVLARMFGDPQPV